MAVVFWPRPKILKPDNTDGGERVGSKLPSRMGMVNKRLIEWKIYEDLVIENDGEEVF
jgi:hypothetical protein